MKIPFLDLKAQYHSIKKEVDEAILNVIENSSFVLGKTVSDFENAFASAHQVKHCAGVSSGTDGNHLVLWALGVGPGDEVVIPANTFIATAWGATLCGAKPVFVDCHPESYDIDPAKIETAITPRTKAIVAVHLYGQAADMEGISNQLSAISYQQTEQGVFVHKTTGQKIYLVEDCAQAHLAEVRSQKPEIGNRFVGGLGKASSFSFYPGKNLGAYGEAGAVLTNDDELAVKFKMLRDHGATQKYLHEIYGHNYRMEGIQGAVLGVKLKYLEQWNAGRRKVAARYREMLGDIEEIVLPKEMEYAKHVWHLYVIQVRSKENGGREKGRDALQKYLAEKGIATGLHYPVPLHLQPCFSHLGYKKGESPVTENLSENGLSLPLYSEMSGEQVEYVGETVRAFFKN
jgi:dTDP-4-amino-4,6-dideoxygalactose transaminase